ncbi:hypothetical protein [Thalassospira sp.]|uniref:DUF5677 domain-containing protein n=1 Tax=Thalassospira sp. TaxID=1912094 RepID=UPI0032EB163D
MKKNHKIVSETFSSIDWNNNIKEIVSDDDVCLKIYDSIKKYSDLCNELKESDESDFSHCFLNEMHFSAQNACILLALGLYKPAASSMRTALESCLYYTYFRTHPSELYTLSTSDKYFISKKEIIDHHKIHTPFFGSKQSLLNLSDKLDKWYSYTSRIIHGQIPKEWNTYSSIKNIEHDNTVLEQCLDKLQESQILCYHLILCTTDIEVWDAMSEHMKKNLLAGISLDKKKTLIPQ